MTSKTAIQNQGLQKLGLDPIISDADKSKSARAMLSAYNPMRQYELRAHNWKFAEVDKNLAVDTTQPIFSWTYAYQLPSDCLRLLQIAGIRQSLGSASYRTGLEGLYTIKGRKILTNLTAPLPITYTSDIEDTTLFDSNFTDMLACRLALQTCIHLTQNDKLKADIAREYKRSLNQALISGSVELPPQGIADDSFVLSRL
jgi:hypothetical protein